MSTTRDKNAFATGVTLSVIAHVGMVLAVLSTPQPKTEAAEEDETTELLAYVAPAELLQWGEEMPSPHQLPNLPNPAPAPEPEIIEATTPPEEETTAAPEETVVLDTEPTEVAEPVETELRSAREEEHQPDRPVRQFRGDHNPNRPVNADATHGSSDGFVGGTSLSEHALRNVLSRLQQQLQRAFRAPRSLTRDELASLSAEVRVRVDSSGRVTNYSFTERSGNRLYDAQVESMLARFRLGSDRLDLDSVSDEGVRSRLENEGFVITIRAN